MSTSAIVKSYTDARRDLDRIAAQRKIIAATNKNVFDEMTSHIQRSPPSTFTTTAPFYSPYQTDQQETPVSHAPYSSRSPPPSQTSATQNSMYRGQHLRPVSLATDSLGLGSSDLGPSVQDTARTAAQQNAIRREELELQMISLQCQNMGYYNDIGYLGSQLPLYASSTQALPPNNPPSSLLYNSVSPYIPISTSISSPTPVYTALSTLPSTYTPFSTTAPTSASPPFSTPMVGVVDSPSVIGAFRQLQDRAKKVEMERLDAVREREEFKIKLSDHVRHSDYMKNQIDLIANERILGLKESYEELQRSRMELEERTQNLQELAISAEHTMSRDKAILSSLENEVSDIDIMKIKMKSYNLRLQDELETLNTRCSRIITQRAHESPGCLREMNEIQKEIDEVTKEIEMLKKKKENSSHRCDALHKYMDLILDINSDLIHRIDEVAIANAHIRPKELPHDCVVDIISEAATDRDMEANEARIIQAARAAITKTQKERESEREKEREREKDWDIELEGEEEGQIEEGYRDINGRRLDRNEGQDYDNERERYHINQSDIDKNDNIGHIDTHSATDGQRERDFRYNRGRVTRHGADDSGDDRNGNERKGTQPAYFTDFNHPQNMSESLSSSQLRHTLSSDRRNDNSNRNGSVSISSRTGEEKFDLRAAYRELHMDPEGLKNQASFSQSLSRRPRTVRAESRRGNGRSKSSTASRNGSKNLSSRSPSRDRSQRTISRDFDPRSSSMDFNSSVSSRFASPPHTSRYTSYSPLGNTNYFPLRSSASGRPLPSHVPMDLHDRNQAAVGYIVSNNEDNYTKALTTAVETVVNDYFR